MKSELRRLVWQRANERCEYCHMPQAYHAQRHHIDHIVANQHEGDDVSENLALACFRCNARKGTNLSGIDQTTGNIIPLFHPRRDEWPDDFAWSNGFLVGKTATGRVTIQVLGINNAYSVELRRALIAAGVSFD